MGRFIIRKVKTGYKFDLFAPNGEEILTSEVYSSRAACEKGIFSVQKNAPSAPVEDETEASGTMPNPKFQLYQDRSGRFRLRLRSRNGKTIAISDAYVTKSGCRDGIDSVKEYAAQAALEEV